MQFCSNGTEFTDVWKNEGINLCFLDTITSSILFLFLYIFGCMQYSMYNKYSTSVEQQYINTNLGSVLQILLTVLMMLESLSHVVTKDLLKENGGVAGVDLLTFICLFLTWTFSLKILSLERKRMLPTIPTRGHGLLLLMFWTLAFLRENLAFISWWSHDWWWYFNSEADHAEFVLWVIRYSSTALLFVLGLKAPGVPTHGYRALQVQEDADDKDVSSSSSSSSKEAAKELNVHAGSTWSNVYDKLKIMFPYVWPKGSWWRQAIVVGCIVILAAGRGINVFVPIYNKYIVNSLTYDQKQVDTPGMFGAQTLHFRWDFICIYSTLLFFKGSSGGSGFLNNMRTFLWIPVQQYTTRRVQVKLFGHLHSLSLSWHLTRKTGEILRVVDRGTNSINSLLNGYEYGTEDHKMNQMYLCSKLGELGKPEIINENRSNSTLNGVLSSYVVFQILPTIVDVIIAIVYFVTAFNYIFGLVVFLAMALYLTVTVYITEWRTKYRREMNKLDNATNSTAVDSLLNFETVKYYGASEFEINRYNEAILKYQKAEWKATASLNLLNTAQNIVITAGVLAGSLLCAWAVVHSLNGLHLTVGDYVLFGTYIIQLYGPLNFLGTYYRMIQTAFIDMENMFELLEVGLQVTDVPGAEDLKIKNGEIVFKDVEFRYDPQKAILKGISFTVPAGQTYALVGHSGSGKSTIIRLLFRFYDVQAGNIYIDGEDIAQVKQESLRQCIGVVPQDTVLFNNDIMYNIRYGRITGSDDDVKAAADAADIHQRILTFTNQYETVVGERGLKLSGGEKQRVAIARTLLKDPHIVLLDEATSALDTKTERNIQSSLARVCQNRTTIIVAHRLSTIIHADMILVLNEGEIIEQGTHDELINAQSHYYEMWQQQLTKLEENNDNNSINGEPAEVEVEQS